MMRTQPSPAQPSLKTWRWLIRRLSLYRDREQRGDSIKLPPAPEYECGDQTWLEGVQAGLPGAW